MQKQKRGDINCLGTLGEYMVLLNHVCPVTVCRRFLYNLSHCLSDNKKTEYKFLRVSYSHSRSRTITIIPLFAIALVFKTSQPRQQLLDVNHIVLEKPAKSDDLVSAQSDGTHGKRKAIRKADTHQSWADMVKSRPLNPANAGLQPLYKG
jgi:hypothetical protein